ncbi:MAG: monovalent cation:proton antiporter-2 (CPA2) family protein [Bdellovibrionota bacterium]
MHNELHALLVLLISAVLLVPIFRYFKLGAILAYLFAGVLIGPQCLQLIGNPHAILAFSELGVVFLLFLIGLELEPARLWNMRRSVFGMGLSQMLTTGLALMGLGIAAGFTPKAAFIAGFGLALSSTAFGLQMLEEQRQLKTLHGQGAFSILLFQDLAVVPLIALIPLLSGVGTAASWTGTLRALGMVAAFIFVGLYFIRHLFEFIARSRVQEVFTATSILIVVGSAILMESVGLSMGTGAFLAGVLLANSEYKHELEINLQPFKGLLLGLFFMAVGMSLDLGVLVSKPQWIALSLLALLLIKGILIFVVGRAFGFPKEAARNMAFILPQGGEFAFVLFAAATTAGLLSPEHTAVLSAAVTLSMAATPLLFVLNQRFLRSFSEVSERPFDVVDTKDTVVLIAGFGRFGQIVSRFLQTQGITFTILEHNASQVDVARRYGRKVFYGDASRKDMLESAGAANAQVFVLAIDDAETSILTARMVREHFPHLHVIARARNRQHALELFELGIEQVHRETYLTSLEVAKEVLLKLGAQREQINKKLALFRSHDERILRKQLAFKGDEKGLISLSNQANAELEEILREDQSTLSAQP